MPMQNSFLLAEPDHWVCAHAKFIPFRRTEGIGCMRMQILLHFGRTEGIGCVPMHNLLLSAELNTLGVCPHFGMCEGIGCVPMQNLILLKELEALGVCPCRMYYFWQN